MRLRLLALLVFLALLALSATAKKHSKKSKKHNKSKKSKKDKKHNKASRTAAAAGTASSSPATPFPTDFRPIRRGDPTLIRLIQRYMSMVYPEGAAELAPLQGLLTNEAEERAFRARRVLLRWAPVECKTTQLKLRKAGTIHKGRRNRVYRLYDQRGGGSYAWKLFENPDEYSAELAFFTVAHHPNIVRPICIQRDAQTGHAGLLMDYVGGGTSMDFAKRNANNPEALKRLSAQAYDVLKYMHWLGFIHADFKPENVMVDADGNCVAIDFGFVIPIPFYKYYRGTPTTVAPELVKATAGLILENIDWWALGSTIAQWYGASVMPVSRSGIKKGHKWVPVRISKGVGYLFGKPPLGFSPDLRQLMFFLMNPDPNLRMFHTEAQLHWVEALPFWQDVNFSTIGFNWAAEV